MAKLSCLIDLLSTTFNCSMEAHFMINTKRSVHRVVLFTHVQLALDTLLPK